MVRVTIAALCLMTTYADILCRVNNEESVVEYKVNGKGVLFTITDGEDIVSIEVPFTLAKEWSMVSLW